MMQAVQAVRRNVSMPRVNEEGYDPHVEHREYERLKEEMRKAKEELAKAKERERALEEALESRQQPRSKQPSSNSSISWKRAIVLSEILGTPRSRRK